MSGKSSAKLHELIAVEKDRKATATRIIDETAMTFLKKQQLFQGFVKVYETREEKGDTFDGEESHAVTNVVEKLNYFDKYIVTLLDVIIQKELTNAEAKADIVIGEGEDAIVIGNDVPVSALVQFENNLEFVRSKVYNTIPTLDPKKNWEKDNNKSEGYYKSPELRKRKTRKEEGWITVVQATEHHPAQVKPTVKDVHTGDWVETHFSGMMSPKDKSDILANLGALIEAVKKARARANDINIKKKVIGDRMFKFIRTGK